MHEKIKESILRSKRVQFHQQVGDKFAISCYTDCGATMLDACFLVPVDDFDELHAFVKDGWGDKKVTS
jgi:hypothetical protein